MRIIDLANFAAGGLIREATFIEKLEAFDFSQFLEQDVLVKGCGTGPVPTWAIMMITARLAQVASTIAYGEEAEPTMIFARDTVAPSA
jgi:hypothetical protein